MKNTTNQEIKGENVSTKHTHTPAPPNSHINLEKRRVQKHFNTEYSEVKMTSRY